ncbi:hypothetical protein Bca4012_000090 [Brassica carinata]
MQIRRTCLCLAWDLEIYFELLCLRQKKLVSFSCSLSDDVGGLRLHVARPATCDLRLIAGRMLLFVLLSRNMRPAIGRKSQVADCCRRSQVARHVNEYSFSRRSQVASHATRKRT